MFLCKLKISFYFASVLCMYICEIWWWCVVSVHVVQWRQAFLPAEVSSSCPEGEGGGEEMGRGVGGGGRGGIEKWTQFYGWVEKIIGPEEKVAIR